MLSSRAHGSGGFFLLFRPKRWKSCFVQDKVFAICKICNFAPPRLSCHSFECAMVCVRCQLLVSYLLQMQQTCSFPFGNIQKEFISWIHSCADNDTETTLLQPNSLILMQNLTKLFIACTCKGNRIRIWQTRWVVPFGFLQIVINEHYCLNFAVISTAMMN